MGKVEGGYQVLHGKVRNFLLKLQVGEKLSKKSEFFSLRGSLSVLIKKGDNLSLGGPGGRRVCV